MKRAKITLESMQIKSLRSARQLAKALTIIEEECGIRSVKLTLKDCFICSWIDYTKLNKTRMEEQLEDIIERS